MGKGDIKGKPNNNQKTKTLRYDDVEKLNQRIVEETPKSGDYLYDYRIEAQQREFSTLDEEELAKKQKLFFRDLPISKGLLKGLSKRNFTKQTEIQRCTLPHALGGRDVIAASRTGSGKTLCYLIPIIEKLYREKWLPIDGLGALILLPTRELAVQVFEVLRSIANDIELSIGLVIGGKSLSSEKEMIGRMNILVCTPGRQLQHLDESFGFNYDNLKLLILDEADEILGLGFMNTIEQILERLPQQRQTMLFSATMSKTVYGLIKLAMNKPENIMLHEIKFNKKLEIDNQEGDKKMVPKKGVNIFETPVNLTQYYMVTKIEDKIDFLFSFLKSHPNSKVLIFVSCTKQVRFIYESFKKLKPGTSMLELHGRQKQTKRMAIFFTYSEKKFASLVTTNLGSRGLDFPIVDWVIQLDCPENVETYVHRIGRTARHQASGKSLIFLTPQEEKFVQKLNDSGIEPTNLKPNPRRQLTIKASLESMCSEDSDLKYLAQRAFISYVKSVHYMSNKEIFDVSKINAKLYAESMGLAQIPIIKFGQTKNQNSDNSDSESEAEANSDNEEEEAADKNGNENYFKNLPLPGAKTSKQKKLEKLKQKIHDKKALKMKGTKDEEIGDTPVENIDDFVVQKNAQHKAKRQKGINRQERDDKDKIREAEDDSDSGDELLLIKRKDDQIDIDEIKNNPWKISKSQMKRVKTGGYYGGKNVKELDDEGTAIDQAAVEKKKMKKKMDQIIEEDLDFVDTVFASKLQGHEEEDKEKEIKRQKEKKAKKKESKKVMKSDGNARFHENK